MPLSSGHVSFHHPPKRARENRRIARIAEFPPWLITSVFPLKAPPGNSTGALFGDGENVTLQRFSDLQLGDKVRSRIESPGSFFFFRFCCFFFWCHESMKHPGIVMHGHDYFQTMSTTLEIIPLKAKHFCIWMDGCFRFQVHFFRAHQVGSPPKKTCAATKTLVICWIYRWDYII